MCKTRPKILVCDDPESLDVGSTRVFSHSIFCKLGEKRWNIDFGLKPEKEYDIVIFGKNQRKRLLAVEERKITGLVNPSDATPELLDISLKADFWITGSYGERDYYLRYKENIVVWPLIEAYAKELKKHRQVSPVVIGYHGNQEHLEQFSPALISSFERLASQRDIVLRAVYNIRDLGKWRKNRPNIPIEDVQWSLESLPEQILSMDIGIAPMLSHMKPPTVFGDRDYHLSFKNSTNPGRIFVFQQFGIPVVAEYSPAALAAIPHEIYGFVACSEQGWHRGLSALCEDVSLRTAIAADAFNYFSTVWNTDFAVSRLSFLLEELWLERRNARC